MLRRRLTFVNTECKIANFYCRDIEVIFMSNCTLCKDRSIQKTENIIQEGKQMWENQKSTLQMSEQG